MRRLRAILPVAAVCAVLLGVLASPGHAATAPGAPEATIATVKPQYTPGDRVELTMSVRNPGGGPCRLAATAEGTVEILEVSRDGKPVSPAFGNVFYAVGHDRVLEQATREVAGGQSISFELTDVAACGLCQRCPAATALPRNGHWTLPGDIR